MTVSRQSECSKRQHEMQEYGSFLMCCQKLDLHFDSLIDFIETMPSVILLLASLRYKRTLLSLVMQFRTTNCFSNHLPFLFAFRLIVHLLI